VRGRDRYRRFFPYHTTAHDELVSTPDVIRAITVTGEGAAEIRSGEKGDLTELVPEASWGK